VYSNTVPQEVHFKDLTDGKTAWSKRLAVSPALFRAAAEEEKRR
jgi:hypothetical protein